MTRLLKIIHILSTLPLFFGSFIFFYWFYKRTWYAEDVKIELLAFFTLLGFLLFAFTTLILCIFFVLKNRTDWKKTIIPIIFIITTFPVIDFYETLHTSLSEKAFVRIKNKTDNQINRIWSENFEIICNEEDDNFVISFYPIYTYDWKGEYTSGEYEYTINELYIDVKQKDGKLKTYHFPPLSKGSCATINLGDIIGHNTTNR